ncbi:MAG: livH 1 [Ramlibacter sp.]|nr:livH 1 [Ramlibacter sp.]
MFFEQLVNGLVLGAIYALIAVGYSLQLSILRIYNLAHGEIMMLSAFAAYGAMSAGGGIMAATAAALAAGAVLGLLLERLALRPLGQSTDALAPLIVTIGVGALLQAAAVRMFGYEQRAFPRPTISGFDLGGAWVTWLQVIILAVGIVTLIALNLLVHSTRFGRAVRATAELPTIARAFGVDIGRVKLAAVAGSSALGGLAGMLIVLNFGVVTPFIGATFALKALVVVIVGGSSINGAFFGGLLLGLIEVVVAGQLMSEYKDALAYGILIVVLAFRPHGLAPAPQLR